jgi:hypothetical protein
MSKTSIFRAGALAAYLAISATGATLLVLPGTAVAQTEGGWRKELADKARPRRPPARRATTARPSAS